MINLLRHNRTLQREDDGAIEFCKIEFHLRNHFSQIQNWSHDRWKAWLAAEGFSKRRYQYCSDDSGRILCLRALPGHSGSNLIDPTLQDNVVIGTGIFNYIYHIGCAFNLHSIINSGIDIWRSEFKQETDSIHWTKGWARKLFDNQKGKLFNDKEELLDKQNSSKQPNQLQLQFVIDQGDPLT